MLERAFGLLFYLKPAKIRREQSLRGNSKGDWRFFYLIASEWAGTVLRI